MSSDTAGSGKEEEEPLELRVAPSVLSTVLVVLMAVVSEDAPPMGRGSSCNNGDGVAAVCFSRGQRRLLLLFGLWLLLLLVAVLLTLQSWLDSSSNTGLRLSQA